MDLRSFYRVSAIVLVAEVVIGVAGLLLVTPGTDVPIHWGADGQPNGYASPLVAFFLMPLITLGIVGLFAAIPRIEPRRANLQASAGSYVTLATGVVVFFGLMQLIVVAAGVGKLQLSINVLVGAGVGILFIVIGRAMRNVRSNFMFGVRTPWTLTSELSWRKTHELVSMLFAALGVALIVVSILATDFLVWVVVGGVVVLLTATFTYSYLVWKRDPDRRTGLFDAPQAPSPSADTAEDRRDVT
jgi:uncharacterized membrane protein